MRTRRKQEKKTDLGATSRTVPAPLTVRVELLEVVIVCALFGVGREALEATETRAHVVVVRLLLSLAEPGDGVGVPAKNRVVSKRER
jgi:hypothetical protein